MPELLFIQMSGVPGAGKTTVAPAIAKRISAVVIDHDVTKSALLEASVPVAIAGAASYHVLNALARHLLTQGYSVIFDSPCLYIELLERGQRVAREVGAHYRYIECVVADLDELDRRLRTLPSKGDAHRSFGGLVERRSQRSYSCSNAAIGRTSIGPPRACGICAATWMASFRSRAVIVKIPMSCSCVAA
jgi:predicted kinase